MSVTSTPQLSSREAKKVRRLSRAAMKRLGLTRETLAEVMDVSDRTLRRYFSELEPLPCNAALAIAEALVDKDPGCETPEIDTLQRAISDAAGLPEIVAALEKWTPADSASLSRDSFAAALADRLVSTGAISRRSREKVEIETAQALADAGIDLSLKIVQIRRLRAKSDETPR